MEKIVCSFAAFVCLLLSACSSTGDLRAGYSEQLLEYQRQIDSLESELRARDKAVADAVREIRGIATRSSVLEEDIDIIIREFEEYQRAVSRLLLNYNAATGTASGTQEDGDYTAEHTYN